STSDPAYQFDRNPNTIEPYELDVELPASPKTAAPPTCVGGTIGVSVLGAPIYSAFDALGRDAAAHEVQDGCDGHPERTGQYHFHSLSDCLGGDDDEGAATRDDGLFGYALDGFGIYVERDANGELLTTADLDECHGRTSEISWRGTKATMYHYVATADFPYLVGCYRGTPITSATGLSIGPPR
ncbi:MAG TPA: YHYH protein, partial [Acidimicrobiales bacterium]